MFDYEFDALRDSVGSGEKKGEKQRGSLLGSQRTMDTMSRRDTHNNQTVQDTYIASTQNTAQGTLWDT